MARGGEPEHIGPILSRVFTGIMARHEEYKRAQADTPSPATVRLQRECLAKGLCIGTCGNIADQCDCG
jgi:hypothetical protein